MTAPRTSPKVSSAPSSSSGFGIGKYFRRAPSPPPNRSVDSRAGQTKAASSPSQQPESDRYQRQKQQMMQRSAVFGSCAQSVGTVASVLFSVINHSGQYDESARDSTVTRQAKILYVSLLESVQKERGEWQGFSSSSPNNNNNGPEDSEVLSPRDLLASSVDMDPITDQLGVLNELLEVSFRNLMGPLVPLELYTRHKKVLLRESLAVPPALTTLFAVRGILDRLDREVRHCLLRLLALWDLIALVGGESQPLLKTIADKYHHVFSESSEFETMTARKSERQDTVAIDLLQIMVLYRDILFSDIEFILTKQEMQINSKLIQDARIRAWPSELGPTVLSEEDDRFSSDGDVSSSYSSDENQVLHDDLAVGIPWGLGAALESPALRSWASSSVPSVLEEQRDGEYYNDDDGEGKWCIPSPTSYNHRHHQDQRSHTVASPPVSGGAGPLIPVPMIPSSSDGIPPPTSTDALILNSRPIERVPSGRRHSQRSHLATPDSPTHSTPSQASSSTKSPSRNLKLRTKQRSSSSIKSNNRIDQQRHENRWQDTASSESRSPLRPSRSTMRRNGNKRMRGSKSNSKLGRRQRSTAHSAEPVQDEAHRVSQNKIQAKPATPSFLSRAASSLAIPVAAATLCVIATMATLAIYEMRRAPRH